MLKLCQSAHVVVIDDYRLCLIWQIIL